MRTVRLRGARITGRLDLEAVTLGCPLLMQDCHLEQPVNLNEARAPVVRLPGCHLPLLAAEQLETRGNLQFDRGFTATGEVRLPGAHIGGQLSFIGATVRNDAGAALNADSLQVDQNVFLSGGFEAVGGGSGVTLDLRQARIGGVLLFAPARLAHTADPQARLALDGLTYTGLPVGISSREWLRLLREGTRSYAAQPYQQFQQFAGGHRAAGHDGEIRRILMAQRQAQIDRKALTGRADRAWARLTGLTLGYGYQSGRALLALVAVATSRPTRRSAREGVAATAR